MKIKGKVLLMALISLISALLCTLFIVKSLMVGYIEKEESVQIRQNYEKALSMLSREESALQSTEIDWAQWDDAYRFMRDGNTDFVNANLQPETLNALKLDYMVFLDMECKPAYVLSNASGDKNGDPVLIEILKKIKTRSLLKANAVSFPVTGLTQIGGRRMFLSLSPVTDTAGIAQRDGFLLVARFMDDEFINYMENVLQVRISDRRLDSGGASPEPEEAAPGLLTGLPSNKNVSGKIRYEKSDNLILSHYEIRDILNDNPIEFVFEVKRELYINGISTLLFYSLMFAAALLAVALICVSLFNRLIASRISRLYDFVENMDVGGDASARINIGGKDEITELAAIVNNMLDKLHASYAGLVERDKRFKRIMEATNDGFFEADLKTWKIYVSPSWLKFMGYEHIGPYIGYGEFTGRIFPEDKEMFESTLSRHLSGYTESFRLECRVLKKNGEPIWVMVRGKVSGAGDPKSSETLVGTISDITAAKRIEEENRYLMYTDPVTTLKNRVYMEELLKKADRDRQTVCSLIMGDVNGLKLVNDSFGHQEGDRLLKTIGGILKKCCRDGDTPARWGGDEFLILVTGKDPSYVEELMQRIREECDNSVKYPFKISIAMGSAYKDERCANCDEVLKLAEERMYHNKLLESRSVRSAVISSLEQSLHEKHIETEEHTKRIKNMCVTLGKYLGMSRDELDELALVGVLHDIGKIAIPETILMKNGELTPEEWEVMKTHAEIGYRIAASTPELAHIADKILSHHERYDGTGYPQGLKGNNIPKLSRLLSVVDSFDAMTHDRVYKKAIGVEKAAEELINCAGKQFDPDIVEVFIKLLTEKKFDANSIANIEGE